MASGPITPWDIDGETVETVSDFIFGGSKIAADGDCSHEIKRCLLLGGKVMTNLDSILKSRDITLPTKVRLVKAMVFPVLMYGCESLTVWITRNWKILKEMGIPDHLTCLLRNLYAGQEATVRTRHGTADWFQIGKGVRQGCILSPCLFNLYSEYITRNSELDEAHAVIKIAGRNINNQR